MSTATRLLPFVLCFGCVAPAFITTASGPLPPLNSDPWPIVVGAGLVYGLNRLRGKTSVAIETEA